MGINLYRSGIELRFEYGKLAEVGTWQPSTERRGDVSFPDPTFPQMLFGYRSFDELSASFPDCQAAGEAHGVLIDVLFPKRPSRLWLTP